MKNIVLALALTSISFTALAGSIDPEEAAKLTKDKVILSQEELNQIVFKSHPNAKIESTELEKDDGKYIYQVDLVDAKNIDYEVHLDASNGTVIKNESD